MTTNRLGIPRDADHVRGFALPAALVALILISALVAAALVVSTEELRAGRTDIASQRAFAAAELALEESIATWDARLNVRLRQGETRVLSAASDARGDSSVVTVMRPQQRTMWITSWGTSAADGRRIPARATVGASLRLVVPAVPLQAALTVGGAATILGGTVDGRDPTGVGDGVCSADARGDVAGIIAPDSSRVCGPDCGGEVPMGVFGAPPVKSSPGLTSDSVAASAVWGMVAERGTATLSGGELVGRPVMLDGACVVADPLNWGDPTGGGPCADHYPVIRITGSASLAAGSVGQGILLVDGSLRVASGARFDGIVLVRNDVTVDGAAAELTGAVIALDADAADGSLVRDGGSIRFASCVAHRALLGAARLARTPGRWWVELR